jgi:hypothetical protein
MTPAEILNRAAEIMEERGKCSGTFRDAKGRVCMIGAIYAVEGFPFYRDRDSNFLTAETALFHALPRGVAEFSDRNNKRDVVRKLRSVAKKLSA